MLSPSSPGGKRAKRATPSRTTPASVFQFEAEARRLLPKAVYKSAAGGALDQHLSWVIASNRMPPPSTLELLPATYLLVTMRGDRVLTSERFEVRADLGIAVPLDN